MKDESEIKILLNDNSVFQTGYLKNHFLCVNIQYILLRYTGHNQKNAHRDA